MPENLVSPERATSNLPINSFSQRREDIFKRLHHSVEQCRINYGGRKELASEKDDTVAELCEVLDEAFNYGLRQQQAAMLVTAASIFQNMQEIVTGVSSNSSTGETTFWDFCQTHLTAHERERYENLKHVWTKCGRGKAFVRASLNENSLQRYLLTWLGSVEELYRFYTPWSLFLHTEMARQLPELVGSLNGILFALTVDTTELNVTTRNQIVVHSREEPIIYAPTPQPVINAKTKRRVTAVERPISSSNSTEDFLSALQDVSLSDTPKTGEVVEAEEEIVETPPPDPIEPELEFLKQPLADFCAYNSSGLPLNNGATFADHEEDKSDTSSQYSKTSSAHADAATNQVVLEQKLCEMTERCALLETRVAQLSRDNRQLVRRLTQHFHESGIDPTSSLASNFLITIPHVKLVKSQRGASAYHAYEIHITMRQHLEHWVLLRRYRDFYKLHKMLLRTHPSVAATVEFPPKKHFGNMNMVFVEERRQQLQIYLLNLVESLPQVEACKSKAELQKAFAFLRER